VSANPQVKSGTSGGPVVPEDDELFGIVSDSGERPEADGGFRVRLSSPQKSLPKWGLD